GSTQVYVIEQGFKPPEYRPAGTCDHLPRPDRSLPFIEVPEVDLPPFKHGTGPRIPDAVMVVVIGRLDAGKNFPLRRPERMYEPTPAVNLVYTFRNRLRCIPIR